jgi:hypothetical protein
MKLLSTILLCSLVFSSQSAWADEDDERYRSPRRFAMEFKFGVYRPNVDEEVNNLNTDGSKTFTPYTDIFGAGEPFSFQFEFDYQIWQGFGSIGIGLSLGFSQNTALACEDDTKDTGAKYSSCSTRTAGSTSFTVFPISVLAVYRFDVLAKYLNIPIVPFVKAGMNYTMWWSSGSSGDTVGGSWGWQVNAGGALLLDWLEPSAAKSLDNDMGINHTYLFFEFLHSRANSFGKFNARHVGDTTWHAGLAIEF